MFTENRSEAFLRLTLRFHNNKLYKENKKMNIFPRSGDGYNQIKQVFIVSLTLKCLTLHIYTCFKYLIIYAC